MQPDSHLPAVPPVTLAQLLPLLAVFGDEGGELTFRRGRVKVTLRVDVDVGEEQVRAPALPPPPPREDDGKACRADVLAVLKEAGKPLTSHQVCDALAGKGWDGSTVIKNLVAMRADG